MFNKWPYPFLFQMNSLKFLQFILVFEIFFNFVMNETLRILLVFVTFHIMRVFRVIEWIVLRL